MANKMEAWGALPGGRIDWQRRLFLQLGACSLGWVLGPSLLRADSPARPPTAHPLDEPLQLIAQARASYQRVQDYTCTLMKREKIEGKLSANTVMLMKVRTTPYSIALRWHEPADLKGQDACYVAGSHDGKIRVRPPGLLAAVGFVSIAVDDPRVRKASKHNITEAGIGNLIERFGRAWEAERKTNLTQVRCGVYDFNKRLCTRVEVTHLANPKDAFLYHRSVVYFDREHHLPVRVECYDWPKPGQPSDLAEVVNFVNLKLNVGLAEELFRK